MPNIQPRSFQDQFFKELYHGLNFIILFGNSLSVNQLSLKVTEILSSSSVQITLSTRWGLEGREGTYGTQSH